ncbi:MAG: autotransporter-associated beta strand repeat-containing protein [Verrucomicrobia bacterium]|nr:autotransporter-associated beta strand repeat-containing protein [Verrucomicrobiota bacterium]
MKPRALPLILATLVAASSARSAQFTWDGGSGNWDTSTTNWTGVAWGNTNADEAVFGGTAGTVTINTGFGVTANKLTFNSDGYVVNGNDSADGLTLAGTTPTVTLSTGLSATIDTVVAGSAGITKSGAGTLVLNGDNTYTGTTTLSGGTLVVGHANALSGTFTGSGASILRLATDASVSAFNLNSGTNNSYTVVADRATPGPALTHTLGSSSLGGGTSTITFQTGTNVTSGTAAVSLASLTLSAGSTNLTTTLNPTTATVTIVGNVDRTVGLAKTLKLDGTIAGNAIDGVISNGSGTGASVSVTKSNTSTWTLNNTASTYTGITTISGGALEVASLANGGSNSSIGASTNAATNLVFGASGAILRYVGTADVVTDRGFTTSSGTGGGATIASSGTGTLGLDNAVAIAYGTANQTRTLTLDGTNTGANTFSKVIANNGTSATSLTKNGTGTWTLDGTAANTHTGTTAINGGRLILAKTGVNAIGGNLTIGNAGVGLDYLQLNASDQIADTSVATFNGSGSNAGIFQLNNQNETIAGLVSTGGAGIVENGNASAGTSTLTLSFASGTQTFSGILQDNGGSGSGILALTKAGAGTQALTGTSTYTGVTTINGGTIAATVLANGGTGSSIGSAPNAASNLVFGAPGAVLRYTGSTDVTTDRSFTTSSGAGGGASISSSGTGTLSFDNTVAIDFGTTAQTRTLTLGGTNTGLNTFSKTITNNGGSATTLTKNGAGRWVLDVANSYSGATNVDAGALRITHGSALGTTGGGTTVGGPTDGSLEIAGGISTSEPITLQGNNNASAANQIVSVSGNNTISANITTTSGGTNHSISSLADKLTISGNVAPIVNNTRSLYLRGAGDGEITGGYNKGSATTATLFKEGTGTWTISGTSTYNGDTTVSGGTLSLGQVNTANDASTVSIASGAVLDLAFAGTDTVDKLFINGVQQPAGPYTSAHPSGAFTGGGTLLVGSGFASWITGTFANGSVPGGQQGPSDDPDKDGISNLVEYAIAGLDPTVSNGAIGTFSGLTLTFTKRTPLATDISYIIETSPDLLNPWTAQVTHGPGNTDPTITYTLPSGGGKVFARLKVEK